MAEGKKTVLIVGMAKSGVSSAKLLAKKGYKLIINDVKRDIPGLKEQLAGIEYKDALGAPAEALVDMCDMVVLSPSVPMFRPFAQDALAKGKEVIGEIELGYRYCDRGAKFVCIGGTNGKTTTTTLTGEIFKRAGKNTFVLGNIGVPITEYADSVKAGDYVVAETASLQLESIKDFRPNAAGLLNITEDHLNRFGSMEAYIAAKARMFENQTADDFAVLNHDDETVAGLAASIKAKVIWFSQNSELDEGMFMRGNEMVWRKDGVDETIIDVRELKIPGRHNIENAMCASCLALCMGVDAQTVRETLREFKGVEHRIELVREKNGIVYINDSKGTNPDSTIKAVLAMTRPTILLLGVGDYDKRSDFKPLFREFGDTVKGVVASGITVPEILEAAEATGFKNIKVCRGTFDEMVEEATQMAKPGYAVLLSPAAASWGMFSDYEERGRRFKEIVKKL